MDKQLRKTSILFTNNGLKSSLWHLQTFQDKECISPRHKSWMTLIVVQHRNWKKLGLSCPFSKYFQILCIFVQFFKYFALFCTFLKNRTDALPFYNRPWENSFVIFLKLAKTSSEPSQMSKTELFGKIVNDF